MLNLIVSDGKSSTWLLNTQYPTFPLLDEIKNIWSSMFVMLFGILFVFAQQYH